MAYQINTPFNTDAQLSPLSIAKSIQHICNIEKPSLILMGKQSVDSETASVPCALSVISNMHLASNISSVYKLYS